MRAHFILKAIDGAPAEFQLLPYGQIDIEGEPPAVNDEAAMALIIADFDRRGHDMVIDYEHQTLSGAVAPAAGWIKKLINKGRDGLFAGVEWTEKARQFIANKEYRFFSPVFWVKKEGRRVIAINNVALTNDPKINNLTPIVAKLIRPASGSNQEEVAMFEKLKKLFGLAADAGEDTVVAAAEAVVAKNKGVAETLKLDEGADKEKVIAAIKGLGKAPETVVACKEVLDALKLDANADKELVVASIKGLGATGDVAKELSLQVAKLSTEIAEMKQDDLVQLALKNGQTSPEELDKWGRALAKSSPDQFKLIVLSRPKGSVVPLEKIGDPPPKKGEGADEAQLSINKMMGIDDETYKKYGPKETD